ncbi:hypothetical protein ACWFR5_36575 [Streptomyces sp. NPDC055092]
MNHTQSTTRRRLTLTAMVTVSAALAAGIALRLAPYHLPLTLHFACVTAAFSTFLSLLLHGLEARETTTHRCTAPGCDFRVRMRHVDAAENRRWQEIASAHPAHRA